LAGLVIGQGDAQLGAGAARLAYSKAEEREADYLGAYLVARAGYDLERAGQSLGALGPPRCGGPQRRRRRGPARTHPAEAERLAAWRRATERSAPRPTSCRGGRDRRKRSAASTWSLAFYVA
jgi:predicted Zn-dependent protease